jgi:DAK2 domain fusion protein YloV
VSTDLGAADSATSDVATIRQLAAGALRNLEAQRQRIDDLNVYPVPDGDTGTNLVLTLRRVVDTVDETHATTLPELCDETYDVALRAGKGNSGVIFSQILRGFARVLGESGEVTNEVLVRALRAASDSAYAAVSRVGAVEGTIVTVIREMAEQAESERASELSELELLRRVLTRGEDAVARTPEMLDVLQRAGVVDAGGAGLVEIVRGIHLAASGEMIAAAAPGDSLRPEAVHQELSRYRYCTGFVVEGSGLDADELEKTLSELGDSLLIVGDDRALKVHVHTDDPGAALSLATALGAIDEVEIANMHHQTEARERRLTERASKLAMPDLTTGVVAVALGEGNRQVFEAENATVVDDPSVEEILAAIEATPAPSVIVLPNDSNVILAAQQAADQVSTKDVRVVPSRSFQAGLAAIVAYVATNSVDENERQMLRALATVSTGELARASRDIELDGVEIRRGSFFARVDGKAVVCDDDFERAALAMVDAVVGDSSEHLSIVSGDGAPELDELLAEISHRHSGLEIEVHRGGQPHYPLLVVAE